MMYRISFAVCALWLAIALVLLAMDGRLILFLAMVMPTTGFGLMVGAVVADQRKASIADSNHYRVADDLNRPMLDVVTDAETKAYRVGGGLMKWE
jgi:hypothetical protein